MNPALCFVMGSSGCWLINFAFCPYFAGVVKDMDNSLSRDKIGSCSLSVQ